MPTERNNVLPKFGKAYQILPYLYTFNFLVIMASENNNTISPMRLSIPKLQGHSNYMGWRRDIRTILSNQKLWTHITDDPPPEPLFSYREPDLTDIQTTLPGLTRAQQTERLRDAIHDYKRWRAWEAAEVNAGQIMISAITPIV